MARWEPNAAERFVLAALDLFAQRGYENTTVIEIAERAGLTKSTFFRHFPDKREVLFGADTMTELLVKAIAAAPVTATPLEAITDALQGVGSEAFIPARREITARRRAVIAANPELQEREALKGLGLTASMSDALKRRGVPDLTARVAAARRARPEDRLRTLERHDQRRRVQRPHTTNTPRTASSQRPLLTQLTQRAGSRSRGAPL